MKSVWKWLVLALALALIIIPWPAILAAPPGLPATFYGAVKLNGADAPSGAVLIARIDGAEVARATIRTSATYGTVYSVSIPADDPDTPTRDGGQEGDTIHFEVEVPGSDPWLMTQTGVWHNGVSTQLNLAEPPDVPTVTPTPTATWVVIPTDTPEPTETMPGPTATPTPTLTPTGTGAVVWLPLISK